MKAKTVIDTTVNEELNTIEQEIKTMTEDMMISQIKTIARLSDEQTRKALIKLGWTPPDES